MTATLIYPNNNYYNTIILTKILGVILILSVIIFVIIYFVYKQKIDNRMRDFISNIRTRLQKQEFERHKKHILTL